MSRLAQGQNPPHTKQATVSTQRFQRSDSSKTSTRQKLPHSKRNPRHKPKARRPNGAPVKSHLSTISKQRSPGPCRSSHGSTPPSENRHAPPKDGLHQPSYAKASAGHGLPAEARAASEGWWSRSGSNRRPPACKAGALPAELRPLRVDPAQPRGGKAVQWTAFRREAQGS